MISFRINKITFLVAVFLLMSCLVRADTTSMSLKPADFRYPLHGSYPVKSIPWSKWIYRATLPPPFGEVSVHFLDAQWGGKVGRIRIDFNNQSFDVPSNMFEEYNLIQSPDISMPWNESATEFYLNIEYGGPVKVIDDVSKVESYTYHSIFITVDQNGKISAKNIVP